MSRRKAEPLETHEEAIARLVQAAVDQGHPRFIQDRDALRLVAASLAAYPPKERAS